MSSPPAAIRLTYLPLAARGFPIRFALRVRGADFTDERVSREALAAARGAGGYSAAVPLGQLPVLEVGGESFVESLPLSRWAAQQGAPGAPALLPPPGSTDALLVDEVMAVVDDVWGKVPMARHWGLADAAALAAARANFVAAVAPRFLDRLAARAAAGAARGGPFVLGAQPSLADAWICALATQIASGAYEPGVPRDLIEAGWPALAASVAAFRAHPLFAAHGEPM